MRYCSLLLFVMPSFAADSAGRVTTVVHADEKSGRLVRSVVVMARAASAAENDAQLPPTIGPDTTALDIAAMIDRIAEEHGVEGSLVHSVIRAESNYNPLALSPKGAQGMMQLIPSTAKRFGVSNSFDPADNVRGGVKYLKFLLDYFEGDYTKTIAAYNAGEAAVDKYQGIPPYPETRNYVYQVAKNLQTARRRKVQVAPVPSKPEALKLAAALNSANAPAPEETHQPIRASVGSDGRVYYRTP